jgi:hypothetical protein
MRNVFLLALVGESLILGILLIQSKAGALSISDILSIMTGVGVLIGIFLSAAGKVSADEAVRKATDAEQMAMLSTQKSMENQALLQQTKNVVSLTHDAVNGQTAMLVKAEKGLSKMEGNVEGRAEEKAEQAIRDEKAE